MLNVNVGLPIGQIADEHRSIWLN